MLFVHDVHAAIGEHEIELDEAVRDIYAPTIDDDDARLAWYLYSTHGAGDAYFAIMITALKDGAAWERLSRRLRYGDLADWLAHVDTLTYSSHSTLMVPTEWSSTAELDLDALPVASEHEVSVFREDTLEGPGIEDALLVGDALPGDVLTCVAGFRPFFSPGGMVRVLYRVAGPELLEPAFGTDQGWDDWTGSLTPSLPKGGHRTSRILRSVPWSPVA